MTWRKNNHANEDAWEFYSVKDAFENGASFTMTRGGEVPKPKYSEEQCFNVVNVKYVRLLTRSSGVLQCTKTFLC